MLEFVDSDLNFVQDKNNFINPLLQVGSGSGSGSNEKRTGSGEPKINGSDWIRILIPKKSGSGWIRIRYTALKQKKQRHFQTL